MLDRLRSAPYRREDDAAIADLAITLTLSGRSSDFERGNSTLEGRRRPPS